VVLLGHGSRDAAGAAEFLAVAEAVQAVLPGLPVEAGVLEFAGPVASSIPTAFARAVAGGARRVLAVPVLLHFGEHGTRDMPGEVAAARARHAGVEIRLAQPLAGHERLLDLVAERCAAAEAALAESVPARPCESSASGRLAATIPESSAPTATIIPSLSERSAAPIGSASEGAGASILCSARGGGRRATERHGRSSPAAGAEANGLKVPPGASATTKPRGLAAGEAAAGTTVLLVGRGSTIARANADLYATARLFQERGPYGAVEVCFVSLAPPCVAAGLRRCAALGARRVLVVPYFVNTGLLVRRIASQIAAARLFYPAVRVAVAAHFGPDPRLIAALIDRARAVWPEVVADEGWRMEDERLERSPAPSSPPSSAAGTVSRFGQSGFGASGSSSPGSSTLGSSSSGSISSGSSR
jgi:precorrin-3B C17-methyltransferase